MGLKGQIVETYSKYLLTTCDDYQNRDVTSPGGQVIDHMHAFTS